MARRSRISLLAPLQERILGLMLLRPQSEWYRSELARELGVTPSSLQRPLAGLVEAGIVTARPDGNRLYYSADLSQPFLPELKSLLAKTSGIAGILRDAFARAAPKVRFAFVYGSVAAGTENATSDIDLLIVGDVGLNDLALPLRKATEKLGREVNPTVFSECEFKAKLQAGNRFLRAVLEKPRLFVIGTANDVEEITG
jgi:predicted nucleotidyltransferase